MVIVLFLSPFLNPGPHIPSDMGVVGSGISLGIWGPGSPNWGVPISHGNVIAAFKFPRKFIAERTFFSRKYHRHQEIRLLMKKKKCKHPSFNSASVYFPQLFHFFKVVLPCCSVECIEKTVGVAVVAKF